MKTASIEQIFVTWTQRWDVDNYIEHYVRTRRLAASDATRDSIRAVLASYPGTTPHTKSALDFFLDANMGRRR
jgi:hypothetical protein